MSLIKASDKQKTRPEYYRGNRAGLARIHASRENARTDGTLESLKDPSGLFLSKHELPRFLRQEATELRGGCLIRIWTSLALSGSCDCIVCPGRR